MSSSTKSFGLYLLLVVFVICQPAGGGTSTYVFLSEHSKAVKVGGIAGVHETYPIQGQFQLTVDANAGVASFDYVDAFLLSPISSSPPQSLGELFNMTELQGNIVDDTTTEFVGKTADGMESDILLMLTFRGDSVHLTGRTVPPLNSADFFIYELDAFAGKKYGSGRGEPNDPYLIYTAEQMNTIGAEPNDWDKHFKLMADIDLSEFTGTDFNIIGYIKIEMRGRGGFQVVESKPFTGVFDGNGHTISNFSYISTDTNYVGLFANVDGENARIKDLGLIDPNIDAGTKWGLRRVGSLVGENLGGTISNCYAEGGSVSCLSGVGGLVGENDHGTITNCYATANVSGDSFVGGLVGENYYGTITNCYAEGGSVLGDWEVGGLVGGLSFGTITDCYATGSVLGNDAVGGLVGGNMGAIITNSYSLGHVTGGEYVGGLVGYNWSLLGTITTCYSAGSVLGMTDAGGLVGWNGGSVTDSFWDVQTSEQSTSAGGTGKTTAEMQMESTFTDAGWDFVGESVNGFEEIWSICEGTNYPRLAWQIPAGDFVCPDGIMIEDFVFFLGHWRDDNCDSSNDYCQGTDLDFSGTVDEDDLEIFVENWLADVRSD